MFHFFDAKLSEYQNMMGNKASCMRKFHFLNSFPLETNFFFCKFQMISGVLESWVSLNITKSKIAAVFPTRGIKTQTARKS